MATPSEENGRWLSEDLKVETQSEQARAQQGQKSQSGFNQKDQSTQAPWNQGTPSGGFFGDTPNALYPFIAYIIYLLSPVLVGLPTLIAVILGYVMKSPKDPEWLQSHYTFVIRTFWYGVILWVLGVVLTFVFVGYLLLLYLLIWTIIRAIKGMVAINRREPITNPTGFWGFGG
jgi:uncharacterized membrane protein